MRRENDAHAKQLGLAHTANTLKRYTSFSGRQETSGTIKEKLSLSFHEMYRGEQLRLGQPGPSLLYQAGCPLMFLKGCSDHRMFKKISVAPMLSYMNKQKGLGYCYRLAEMCSYMPSYQGKTRAFTIIQDYLTIHQLYLAKR